MPRHDNAFGAELLLIEPQYDVELCTFLQRHSHLDITAAKADIRCFHSHGNIRSRRPKLNLNCYLYPQVPSAFGRQDKRIAAPDLCLHMSISKSFTPCFYCTTKVKLL